MSQVDCKYIVCRRYLVVFPNFSLEFYYFDFEYWFVYIIKLELKMSKSNSLMCTNCMVITLLFFLSLRYIALLNTKMDSESRSLHEKKLYEKKPWNNYSFESRPRSLWTNKSWASLNTEKSCKTKIWCLGKWRFHGEPCPWC